MVDSIEIYNQAEDLSGRFGTRNPEEIATGLGIMIYEADNFQNLVLIKIQEMNRMGYTNLRLPNIPDSCFLAKIKCDTRIND